MDVESVGCEGCGRFVTHWSTSFSLLSRSSTALHSCSLALCSSLQGERERGGVLRGEVLLGEGGGGVASKGEGGSF